MIKKIFFILFQLSGINDYFVFILLFIISDENDVCQIVLNSSKYR